MTQQPVLAPASTTRPGGWQSLAAWLLAGLGAALLPATLFVHGGNWWALFIYVTALGLWAAAWPGRHWHADGVNLGVRLCEGAGALVMPVALIFLLDLSWDYAWTLIIMMSGLVIGFNGLTRWPLGSVRHSLMSVLIWAGLSTILLGATFLLDQLGFINLAGLIGRANWWAAFILLPGLGALLNALIVFARRGLGAGAGVLLAIGLLLCVEAASEFAGLPVRWTVPLLLVAGGVGLLFASRRA